MAKPYDYMVARMLLAMANKSEGLEFANVEHASGEVGWSNRRIYIAHKYVFSTCPSCSKQASFSDRTYEIVFLHFFFAAGTTVPQRPTKLCARPVCSQPSEFVLGSCGATTRGCTWSFPSVCVRCFPLSPGCVMCRSRWCTLADPLRFLASHAISPPSTFGEGYTAPSVWRSAESADDAELLTTKAKR